MAHRFRSDKRYVSWLLQQKRKKRQQEPVEPVVAPLKIVTQPVDAYIPRGSTLAFTVSIDGGVAPYTYDWGKGSPVASSLKSNTYSKTNAGAGTDGGSYLCVIRDAQGSQIISNSAIAVIM